MENPIFKWMIWGYHYFRKHPTQFEVFFERRIFVEKLDLGTPQVVLRKSNLKHKSHLPCFMAT